MPWTGGSVGIPQIILCELTETSQRQGYKSVLHYKSLQLSLCHTHSCTPRAWWGFNFEFFQYSNMDGSWLCTPERGHSVTQSTEQLCPSCQAKEVSDKCCSAAGVWCCEHSCGAHPTLSQCQQSKSRAACTLWRHRSIQHNTRTYNQLQFQGEHCLFWCRISMGKYISNFEWGIFPVYKLLHVYGVLNYCK